MLFPVSNSRIPILVSDTPASIRGLNEDEVIAFGHMLVARAAEHMRKFGYFDTEHFWHAIPEEEEASLRAEAAWRFDLSVKTILRSADFVLSEVSVRALPEGAIRDFANAVWTLTCAPETYERLEQEAYSLALARSARVPVH